MSELKRLANMCGDNCRWFLVGLTRGEMSHYDGCWSDAEDVGRALFLRNSLHLCDEPDEWLAVHIEPVRAIPDTLNRASIIQCNEMLDAYYTRAEGAEGQGETGRGDGNRAR
jgi:hypothetical protein